jgi:hypothetical protein
MLRLASLLIISLPLITADAYAACEGQPGEVIFEDSFEDDLGGWSVSDDAKFANGELTLHNQDPNFSWLYWNNTFNVTDGDYCAEVVQPTSAAGDNVGALGLLFLGEGDNNTFLLQVGSDNLATMWKKAGTAWAQLGSYSTPDLKLSPGSAVTLRVIVKERLIKPFINGVEVRGTRAQVPTGPLKFGIYAQNLQPVPAPGSDFVIKEIRITSGE